MDVQDTADRKKADHDDPRNRAAILHAILLPPPAPVEPTVAEPSSGPTFPGGERVARRLVTLPLKKASLEQEDWR